MNLTTNRPVINNHAQKTTPGQETTLFTRGLRAHIGVSGGFGVWETSPPSPPSPEGPRQVDGEEKHAQRRIGHVDQSPRLCGSKVSKGSEGLRFRVQG